MAALRKKWSELCRLVQAESATAAAAAATAAAEAGLGPCYPPVVASVTAKSKAAQRRRQELFHQLLHEADSIEKKLKLYEQRQRRKFMLYPQTFSLYADRSYQSFTKTAFVPGLPPALWAPADLGLGLDLDLGALRGLACDALLQEHFYLHRESVRGVPPHQSLYGPFLTQLVASLSARLALHNPLLAASTLDLQPQVNFYWMRGEEVIRHGHRSGRVDPVRFQIDDKPVVQIRVPKQLPEFVPLDHLVTEEIPVIKHTPDKLPMFKRQYENKVFIGSKVADPCKYGHTQFHLIPYRLTRKKLIKKNLAHQVEVVNRANGIASLFAWTAAQAMYQGFWSEADVTRPFVSQAVVTDGQYFAFFCYQLNTLALTVEADKNNPRKNICWGTDSKPLYEAVEENNIKGFNDEVLLQLVQFLLNRPEDLQTDRLPLASA
ncbi:39S ribosomal protein S30, mitochondrial [Alligator sinensis]|uniref:39S ribosomal protein S30, mitochondrial n=1 Tax=Alligator sinensis TaxID=38654 RepID=A0A1U7S9S7_ALLSI|nr:39S ribosomal protein S30, mitochondrial [Alligator sinensis]